MVGDEEELRKKNQWSDQKNKKAQVIFNDIYGIEYEINEKFSPTMNEIGNNHWVLSNV